MKASGSHGKFGIGLIGLGIMLVLVTARQWLYPTSPDPSGHANSNRYTDYHRYAEPGICVLRPGWGHS